MDKDTKIVFIIVCILIVLSCVLARKYVVKLDETSNILNTINNSIVAQNTSKEEKTNEIQENTTEQNNIEENISENIVDENIVNEEKSANTDTTNNDKNSINSKVQGLEETTSSNEEKRINKKEQALKLVEEEWGEDNTVYYTIDNEYGNIYSISVRSKSTTAVLQEFEVDSSKGTVNLK